MSASRVRELLQALPDSRLPADLRKWLTDGFKGWLQDRNLEDALELQGQYMGRRERDDYIRTCVALSPGESLSAKCMYFLRAMDGEETHPDPTARKLIELMRDARVYMPSTVRHIRSRIMHRRRSDSWRHDERTFPALCPSWAPPDNRAELDKTGTENEQIF